MWNLGVSLGISPRPVSWVGSEDNIKSQSNGCHLCAKLYEYIKERTISGYRGNGEEGSHFLSLIKDIVIIQMTNVQSPKMTLEYNNQNKNINT